MTQNGKTLSMHNGAIWKGTYTNNGMLLKIHENAYTIGYSALLSPDGTSAGKVKFGDGVFYDAHQRTTRLMLVLQQFQTLYQSSLVSLFVNLELLLVIQQSMMKLLTSRRVFLQRKVTSSTRKLM